MTEELYPILEQHGNTIQNDVDEEEYLYADPEKMARVFNNLLKNAAAYSDPDTPIVIRSEQSVDSISIMIENTGVTIPEEKLEIIFENSSAWILPVLRTPAVRAWALPSQGRLPGSMAAK